MDMSIGHKDPQLEIVRLRGIILSLETKLSRARGEKLPKNKRVLQEKLQELRKANWDLTFALLHAKETIEKLEEDLWITRQKASRTEYNRV